MKYNFDQIIERKNTYSMKWNLTAFGREDVLPMWVADMDFASPPEVIEALQDRATHGVYGYVTRPNDYYAPVQHWLERRHRWKVREEWLGSSPGVVQSLAVAVNEFTEPGDKVLIQTPVYYPFYDVIRMNDREIVRNPLVERNGRYEMDFENLEFELRAGIKLMFLCSPHNPIGRVWDRDELEQLGALCEKYNVLVVADEIHADIVFPGKRHHPFAGLSDRMADRTIACIAPSKTFNMAGLQSSITIIPNPKLRQRFNHRLKAWSLHMEHYFNVTAVGAAYQYGEPWLDQMLDYVKGNLDLVCEFVQTELAPVKAVRPEGTYLVWLDFRGLGMDVPELKKWMIRQAGVVLNEGSTFGEEGAGFLRMNIGCPRSIVEEGLRRLKAGLDQL